MAEDKSPADSSSGEKQSSRRGSDTFFEQVYDELRAIAHARMRKEQAGYTLQSTELVHEAYLRLSPGARWDNRHHFFAAAAEAMRRILIDRARAKGRLKRGGDEGGKPAPKVALDIEEVAALADDSDPEAILALDRTIENLAHLDERAAQVIKLRFYAGLSVDEVAETLDVSRRTVLRDWEFARIWLYKQLSDETSREVPGKPPEQ